MKHVKLFEAFMDSEEMNDMEMGKSIVDIAIESPDHSTLVAAVKAAELVPILAGDGPFTVFAPTNSAFQKLPQGTLETLLKIENKPDLAKILTYHVIAGNLDASSILQEIENGGGQIELETVSGDILKAFVKGGEVILSDENGGFSTVIATDLKANNGIVHVIDSVLLPAS